MTKQLKPGEYPTDYPIPLADMAIGRNWIREKYSNKYEYYDNQAFMFWEDYLSNIALAAFKWENLPAGIDPRALEFIFLNWGMGGLFMESGGYLFAQCTPVDTYNLYYNPNEVTLVSPVGRTWIRHNQPWGIAGEGQDITYRPRDCVVGFDNMRRTPLNAHIKYFARRLATYDAIADLNTGAQRTPYIIRTSEQALKSNQELYSKLERNDQVLYLNDAPGTGLPEVLQTQAPYIAEDIFNNQKKILDLAMTIFGADNSNTEKRERVQTKEAMSNNEQIMLLRRSRLMCRERFCEEVNRTFELKKPISVSWAVPHMAEPNDARYPTLTGNEGWL